MCCYICVRYFILSEYDIFRQERAIWKFPHRHLGISIGIDVGISIGVANILVKFLFLSFKVSYEENIYCEVLFKHPCTLPGSFSCCIEKLFCRKPVSTYFWRKEIYSRSYLRSFKKIHGWKLHFTRLWISDQEPH